MGEIGGHVKNYLQIDGFRCELTSSQILGFCGGFPGFRQRDRVAAQPQLVAGDPVARNCRSSPEAAARATAQLPKRRVTTLAAGPILFGQPFERLSPHRRACVRDQSYEDGSPP
jgi:hypothetical protein